MPTHANTAEEEPRLRNLANRKITSSLFLQQLLYYGLVFDFGWIIFQWAWLFATYWSGITYRDPDIIRTVAIIIWLVFNPVRTFAGWYGNLQETLPWLILYCILTLAPLQMPVWYMILGAYDRNAVTLALAYLMAVLYLMQLVIGIYAGFRMYWMQKHQYYLFEYVMNQRRRNDVYRMEGQRDRLSSSGGGIGRGR